MILVCFGVYNGGDLMAYLRKTGRLRVRVPDLCPQLFPLQVHGSPVRP